MTRSTNLPPTHPGELLREDILPAMKQGKSEIARLLGVSRTTLYDILNEKKPVTPQMALRLAKLLGTSPEVWANLQQQYDFAVERVALADELKRIPTLEAV